MEINFHIPDFTNHLYLNTILINSISKYPEYFHDGLRIASVFGNFGGSVWNGGRFLGGMTDMNFVKHVAEAINSKNIPLRIRIQCLKRSISETRFAIRSCVCAITASMRLSLCRRSLKST